MGRKEERQPGKALRVRWPSRWTKTTTQPLMRHWWSRRPGKSIARVRGAGPCLIRGRFDHVHPAVCLFPSGNRGTGKYRPCSAGTRGRCKAHVLGCCGFQGCAETQSPQKKAGPLHDAANSLSHRDGDVMGRRGCPNVRGTAMSRWPRVQVEVEVEVQVEVEVWASQ